MWARRLSHRLMMAGPLVLVSAIAINARSGPPYENRAEFGDENHKRLLAFVPPVRAAEELAAATPEFRHANLERVVQLWLGLSDTKALMPVMPADFDTSPQETVLNDIKSAKLDVIFGLQDQSAACRRDHDPDSEALVLTNMVRISAIDKYTEFATVHQFGTIQIRALQHLGALLPELRPEVKRIVASELSKAAEAEGRLSSVVAQMRDLHSASLLRNGIVSLPIEWAQSYEAMLDATDSIGTENIPELKPVSAQNVSFEMAGIGAIAKLAVKTDTIYRRTIKSTLARLQSAK